MNAKKDELNSLNYKQLDNELEDLLAWFEGDDFNIDEAEAMYQKSREIVKIMQTRLAGVEQQIKKHNPKKAP